MYCREKKCDKQLPLIVFINIIKKEWKLYDYCVNKCRYIDLYRSKSYYNLDKA